MRVVHLYRMKEQRMSEMLYSIGSYLAARFEQVGLTHYFAVAGDYNLLLLDELLKNKNLTMINCCNELNAGYAADGYARAHGVAALVITYSVGGLSALNAIAGAYAEDVPIIVISGAPGTEAEIRNHILHHTLGKVNYRYVRDIYQEVTSHAVTIQHAADASYQIDEAFRRAIQSKKPVYIEIPCNIATFTISQPRAIQYLLSCKSDIPSLEAAVDHAASLLNTAKQPLLIAGVKLRAFKAIEEFEQLVDASKYAFATMANAKGFLSEEHPQFIGIYWGDLNPATTATVESSDMCLFAGPLFTDYTMAGFSVAVDPAKLIHAAADYVRIAGQIYSEVNVSDFLAALSKKVRPNEASFAEFTRYKQNTSESQLSNSGKNSPGEVQVTIQQVYEEIQKVLDAKTTVFAETGDTWANAMELTLPKGCGFEIQLQYASIGWSLGATLGSAAASPMRRIITLIGDGSFQMTCQEISTMIRFNLNPIILVINNYGYLIERLIHDGPYNNIQNWKYSELVGLFNGEKGKGWGCRATTQSELRSALEKAQKHEGLSLIEVITRPDDSNPHSVEFGKEVAAFNKTQPKCS